MLKKLSWGLAAVFLAWVIAMGEPLAKGEMEGRLLKVVGQVRIERDGAVVQAAPQAEILGGDVIVTGPKSEASIDLGDNRIITVKENSQFSMDEKGTEPGDGSSAMVIYGIVYVRKPASPTPGRPFQIQTPTAVAGVRGTDFAVAVAADGESRFAVEEGEITVETDGGGSAEVGLMQEVTVESDEQSSLKAQPYRLDEVPLDQWRRQRMDRILQNPLPVVKRLALNLRVAITRGDRLLTEAQQQTEQVLEIYPQYKEYSSRGQAGESDREKMRMAIILQRLIPTIRKLVRLDNRIQSRMRLMNIILAEARAEGSPTPPAQVRIIENNIQKVKDLEAQAAELHRGRLQFMRANGPQLRQIVILMR